MRRVAIRTLGCRLNQADSEDLARRFLLGGYQVTATESDADVIVVNSCTVTNVADKQSRQAVRQAARARPEAFVVLTGCYPSVAPAEAARVPGVALVLPNRDKVTLVARVTEALAARNETPPEPGAGAAAPAPGWLGRTRVQLKVEEGCNNRCAFCIVPLARGVQRSRSLASCVQAVQGHAEEGYREVVLTGTHLGGYGRDLGAREGDGRQTPGLADLVAALLSETAIARIRLSSVEPQDFPRDRLNLWQDPRLCPHFHLPVQSGSDRTLRRMRRGYNRARYLALVEAIRRTVPQAAITTDVIVGFPGETADDFADTLALVDEVGFAKTHCFPYSPRAGTAAATMAEQVDAPLIRERMTILTTLTDAWAARFRQRHVGQTVDVLWENQSATGEWQGLTSDYLRVRTTSGERLANRILPTYIRRATARGAEGDLAAA